TPANRASGMTMRRISLFTPLGCSDRRCRGVAKLVVRSFLEVPAQGLLALDRLEERLEVPLAEAARAVSLDHLEEQGWPVLRGLGEDLQQVAVLVAVGEDPQPHQIVPVLADLTDPVLRVLVVGVRSGEEDDAVLLTR